MKLGIIGTGMIVQEFLPRLAKIPGIEIVALQGEAKNAGQVETLCKENGIPHAVYDFSSLCGTGVDTVYIAVPNFLHFAFCKQALEQGRNVIVEKPMTSNAKEALYLEKLAKEKHLFLFEAITTLYLKNYHKVQEWLPKIGRVRMVQSQYSQYSRRYDAFQRGEILPAFDPQKSGGALMDLNLYNLHFVMGLFGQPNQAVYHANVERGIDTSGVLTMQYPDFQAFCVGAKDCRGVAGSVIQGTLGCIKTATAPSIIGKVTLELNDGTIEEFDDGMAANRLIPEFTAFVNAINTSDLDFCYRMLEKSVAVSRVQTEARFAAGIHFPADDADL